MPSAGIFLLLYFALSLSSVSGQQLNCGPGGEAVEGTQHVLTCGASQAGGTVSWVKRDRNLGDVTVATCDATGCQTNFSTRYDVKRVNNVTSTLKILEVKRDDTFVEGEWSCYDESSERASCYVSVVYLPHMGKCEVGFNEQSGQVTGQCEMHKVYPRPTCNWYEHLQGQETAVPNNQTSLSLTQYVDASSSQIYFRATCQLHRPLPVTAGSYVYTVLITPGLVEPPVAFTSTDRVGLPAPPALQKCPQDYITEFDVDFCLCMTLDLGSPEGSLAWYDPDNNIVVRNTSLILALPFARVTAEFSEQTYRCAVIHHTGSPSVDYVPKIAVPPNTPKLSGLDKSKVYEVGETITFQCSADGGRPAITRVILQCAGRPDEVDSHVGGSVISRLSLTLHESHLSGECVCYATNGFSTSQNVTLPIGDIMTSDSGKGDKLASWHVVLIVLGGALAVLGIFSGVVAYKKYKCWKCTKPKYDPLESENAHLVEAGGPADATSDPTEENGAGAATEKNDLLPSASCAKDGPEEKRKHPSGDVNTLVELSQEKMTPGNDYGTQQGGGNQQEKNYSTIEELRAKDRSEAAQQSRNDSCPTHNQSQKIPKQDVLLPVPPQAKPKQDVPPPVQPQSTPKQDKTSENTQIADGAENPKMAEDQVSRQMTKDKQATAEYKQNTVTQPGVNPNNAQTPATRDLSAELSDSAQAHSTEDTTPNAGDKEAMPEQHSRDSGDDDDSRGIMSPVDDVSHKLEAKSGSPSESTTGQ